MAVYVTTTDLGNYGVPAATVAAWIAGGVDVEGELAAVSSEADSYLRKVATLPLVSWDVVLTQKVCHRAAFNLYSAQGFNPDAPGDQALLRRSGEALRWLEQLAAGEVTLGFVDLSVRPQVPEGGPVFLSEPARGGRRWCR